METRSTIESGAFTDANNGKHGVRLIVTNISQSDITALELEFVWEHNPPIKHEIQTAGRTLPFWDTGGRTPFKPALGQSLPIRPGEECVYLYDTVGMPLLKSLVNELSPDQYWVAIKEDDNEWVAIPGDVFGEFVNRRFPEVETLSLKAAFADPRFVNLFPAIRN